MADNVIVVFDFDKTIIDCDSDNWVVDDLGGTRLFDQLLETMPWNSAMDRAMGELHSRGRTVGEITASLRRAPLPARTVAAVKAAHALGCELRIVSDANRFFIETILDHHGLAGYFSEINTNPGFVDEEGRLRVLPHHDFETSSHGCRLCPPNMCKGAIIERMQASAASLEGRKRFIYLGDGKGDYCPALRLSEEDCVMPRRNHPVWELILADPRALRAEIHGWGDAEELEEVLLRLIGDSISARGGDANRLISADCKFQTSMQPLSSREALPKPLRVPN